MKSFKFFCFLIVVGFVFASQAYGQTSWVDDFESYSSGDWPWTWSPDGNAHQGSSNYIDDTTAYQGNRSLRLFGSLGGCWGALAYRPLNVSAPFEVEVKIKNGDESLYGCHPDRGGFGLRQGTYWGNPARTFIKFFSNGTIENSGGAVIGNYSTLNWYTVKVRYERPSSSTVKLSYWIDGVYKGEEVLLAKPEEDQITNVELVVQEGSAWFDEVKVSPVQAVDFVDPYSADMQVVAGGAHTVGLKANGLVVAVGDNQDGQCDVSSWYDIKQITAGDSHTIGLKSNGSVVAAGSNSHGQLNVSSWANINQISAGFEHTIGLKTDGKVVAAGNNSSGQCDVSAWNDIKQVSAGYDHTVGLKNDGTVVAVGENDDGQCNVSSWDNILQIVTGINHTVGLKSDGTVVAVGSNSYGQCNVSSWSELCQISAGSFHTVGLKTDGTVAAVGYNTGGQCEVSSWNDILQISAGMPHFSGGHTIGLKSDGSVTAVGSNEYCHPLGCVTKGQLNVSSWDLDDNQATWYQDSDADGYGNGNISIYADSQPYGYVLDSSDCNDYDDSIFPGANDIADDGVDQDCSGVDFSSIPGNPLIGTLDNISESSGHYYWGDGINDLHQEWSVANCDKSGWFYGSSSYANTDIYVYKNLSDPASVTDASLFQYTKGSIVAEEGDTVFFKGTNGYYGAWVITSIECTNPNNTYSSDLNGFWYFVSNGSSNFSIGSETYFQDSDNDGYGNPNTAMNANSQPSGYVSDNTDCNDKDDSIYPGATEIAGDGIDQDCDGADSQLSGPGKIFLLSPSNNETIGYGSSGGKVTFSFSKVADAAKYVLHFSLHDILAGASIPIPVDLIPPGSSNPWGGGGAATPGFSEQFVGMVFELSLDSATWDVLALYDLEWGVEAYDSGGELIGSTFSGSSSVKYVNSLKFLSSNAIVMTSPVIGADLVKTDSAPVFKWDTYQGVATYLMVLAHVGTLGFDTVIAEDNLTLNLFPMSNATWQSMPVGQWYWAVAGYDSFGNLTPGGFTIFDFEVSQQ